MSFTDSQRLGTRLFAIGLRLAELDHELRQTQIRVHQLESQLEDARLAQMMGEEAGDPSAIRPELERSLGTLETQREMVARVRNSQWKARVEYTLARVKERREERNREGGA